MNNKQETIEIKVPIQLDYLFEMAASLTLSKKKQLLSYLQDLIYKDEAGKDSKLTNQEYLLTTDLGKYIQANANPQIDIKKIRQELAQINDSIAEDVYIGREER